MQYQIPLVPKRSSLIYKQLCKAHHGTAKELAKKVHCTPNAVYRDIQPLISLGLVEQSNERPARYVVTPQKYAEELYVNTALRIFREQFSLSQITSSDSIPSISFIKDRKEMREVTEQEAERSKKSICVITSGHRVAESTIDTYRKASCGGVELKAIIENHPKMNKNVDIDAYESMRFATRYLANLGMRLYIFDGTTVVLTSYDPRYPMRAFGIRFAYSPVAKQLQELYDKRWFQAAPVKV